MDAVVLKLERWNVALHYAPDLLKILDLIMKGVPAPHPTYHGINGMPIPFVF